MTHEELSKEREQHAQDLFIISKHEQGYRIYSPIDPGKKYIVSGTPETPACSCPDFRSHQQNSMWRCKHILAIWNQSTSNETHADTISKVKDHLSPAHEKSGSQGNGTRNTSGASQMVIKRSVSPDGRINSLSVEFSWSIEKISPEEITCKASDTLMLQAEIVERFLKGHKRDEESSDNAIPAKMLTIGSMPGKWGRRLFINVEASGQALKLFGNRKQLAEYIMAIGFAGLPNVIEGVRINLPCRVITKPSEDGKYLYIAKVLPPKTTGGLHG